MSNQIRVKIVARPLGTTHYHLATFDHKLAKDSKMPSNILEEVTQDQIQKLEKEELSSADAERVTINAQRKLKKLKYRLEVEAENQKPQRFRGYQDETYQASGEGGGANYAIMIYDSKNNQFKLVPVEKHFRFEKEIIQAKKKREVEVPTTVETSIRPQPQLKPETLKLSSIQTKRNKMLKIFNEQKKLSMGSEPVAAKQFMRNAAPVAYEEEVDEKGKKKRKKKEKPLKLDYKEMNDDDDDDYNAKGSDGGEDDDEVESEQELSEDGEATKARMQQENDQQDGKPLFQGNFKLQMEQEDAEVEEEKQPQKPLQQDPDANLYFDLFEAELDNEAPENEDGGISEAPADESEEPSVGTKRSANGGGDGSQPYKRRRTN